MQLSELFIYSRSLTKTTSSQFSDNTLLTFAKIWLHKIQREVASIRSDFFGTKDYTMGQLDQEDYPLPEDLLELKSVEACYNAEQGESSQVWTKAFEIDVGQNPNAWDTIQKNASTDAPVFDILDNRLYFAPIRTAVIGSKTVKIRLWYIERPIDPTATTDTPLISTTNQNLLDYQPLIAEGLCYDILTSLGSPRANEFLNRYEVGIVKMKREIRQQNIGNVIASHPYNDGSNY